MEHWDFTGKKLVFKYILKHLSSVLLQFLPSKEYFKGKKSNYKNNCILDGFLVLTFLKCKKAMYFLRNVVMWPTDFMVTVWLSPKSWVIFIDSALFWHYPSSHSSGERKPNHTAIRIFKCQLSFLRSEISLSFALHLPFQKEGDWLLH